MSFLGKRRKFMKESPEMEERLKKNPKDYNAEYELYTKSTKDPTEAKVITSQVKDTSDIYGVPHHQPVLDLDVEHHYFPSSTPGHGHLYINCEPLNWRQYKNLLEVLADCGIIEREYAEASIAKGYSAVRLPWVQRENSR
jgi:hypothetical protein